MSDVADKLSYFQAITGVEDVDLCREILSAHGWDLQLAVSSFTSTSNSDGNNPPTTSSVANVADTGDEVIERFERSGIVNNGGAGPPGLVWNIITLPISVISGSLGLVSSAIGLGFWIAGGVLSYSLGLIGLSSSARNGESSSAPLVSETAAAWEAMRFVSVFEQTLCSEVLSAFINENFVAWGGSVRASEGFKMSNSLKASKFPICAVVMAATNQRIALLQQVEGPKSPEEMLTVLQRVLEESSPVLVAARLEAEERINNIRLREEQDAAYRAALEADQARERQRKEEEERLAREAAEAERKQKEDDEAREKAAREAAERETALVKLREEKALSLGLEHEKGPDVTQVLVRLPNGERKGRRFNCTATIQSLYDFVDSSSSLEIGNYTLATNFPRVLYGRDKLSSTLKEAGLHPQVSLFVELNS
ncbi:hypothetical protein L1987_26077 [Smallanthus sonchifolius]|uniref:Uncharacterized protein n=1 Tax=Smallanthus sonchifolius TaxID=185202 RepID=A0ACB9I9L4_9ASTR|nr:hypothetical protein L1987_26077 [Smallanthus sonchifolius]